MRKTIVVHAYIKGLFLILTSSCFFLLGYYLKGDAVKETIRTIANDSPKREVSSEREGIQGLINPILDCQVEREAGGISDFSELPPLRIPLERLIAEMKQGKYVSDVSVYLRDLNNGPWIGIDEKTTFTPASLSKVPLMLTYFKIAEKDSNILEREVLFAGEAKSTIQHFKPSKNLVHGKTYKIGELIENMIIHSDNDASELLRKELKEGALDHTFEELGINILNNGGVGDLRVKDYSAFFRVLFNSSYLTREYSQRALELLARTNFNHGITKDLPQKIVVAHKFGERVFFDNTNTEKQLHDCGIVYYPAKPYLLCIMTRGNDFEKLAETISAISSFIYTQIDQYQQEN